MIKNKKSILINTNPIILISNLLKSKIIFNSNYFLNVVNSLIFNQKINKITFIPNAILNDDPKCAIQIIKQKILILSKICSNIEFLFLFSNSDIKSLLTEIKIDIPSLNIIIINKYSKCKIEESLKLTNLIFCEGGDTHLLLQSLYFNKIKEILINRNDIIWMGESAGAIVTGNSDCVSQIRPYFDSWNFSNKDKSTCKRTNINIKNNRCNVEPLNLINAIIIPHFNLCKDSSSFLKQISLKKKIYLTKSKSINMKIFNCINFINSNNNVIIPLCDGELLIIDMNHNLYDFSIKNKSINYNLANKYRLKQLNL